MLNFAFHGFYSFTSHIAFFLGLISLGLGFWIYAQAKGGLNGSKLGKGIGILIVIGSLLGLTCITYLTIKRCCLAQKDWHQTHMQMMMSPDEPKDVEEKGK